MKTRSLVFASFRHYWRSHLGLLFGAFLASAILSGSLLVGDSVRASLRRAAAERLGAVGAGLLGGDRWFTEELARKLHAAPMILLRGSVSESTGRARANAVQVIGVDDEFWKFAPQGDGSPLNRGSQDGARVPRLPGGKDALAINESLAHRLGVKAGDTLLLRLEKPSAISRDAPLSGEANQDITLRRKITAVIGGGEFGNFQLQASQSAPDNLFLPLADLEETLGKKGRVNALVTARRGSMEFRENKSIPWGEIQVRRAPDLDEAAMNRAAVLEDFSLKLNRPAGSSEWELTTDRIFLDDAVAQKLLAADPEGYGVLTYLVNSLGSAKGRAPYSMVTALPEKAQGSRFKVEHPAAGASDSVIVTQWLAEDLQLVAGDKLDVHYFTVGLGRDLKEQSSSFIVRGILPMTDAAVNPSWAPDFPGVTEAKNCRDWQPGIPMKLDTIRDKDEAYWKQYKTTPKAFISLAAGRALWSNRFGNLTAIRFPDHGQNPDEWKAGLTARLTLADIGLRPRDFRSEATAAAKGSVNFGGLFVGLSLFLIAASLVFSILLFLFTLEKRASQIGLLLSLGWREKQVRRAIFEEAGLVAVLGAALGLVGGLAYTSLALQGLNSIWKEATAGFNLAFHAEPLTLVIAFGSSVAASVGTLWLVSRRICRVSPRDLLVGEAWGAERGAARNAIRRTDSRRWRRWAAPALLVAAILLPVLGARAHDPAATAGMFFGSGFCLLAAGLLLVREMLAVRVRVPAAHRPPSASLPALAARNVTRRPGRSVAVIGMMAGGIFLVIAVNAFRIGAVSDFARRDSGTGGFALLGESTLPIYEDLNLPAAREAFALDEKVMQQVSVVPFRVREGDDASCLNLNKAQQPQLVGVNWEKLGGRMAFRFAATSRPLDGVSPWELIGNAFPIEASLVPAIADQATAMWGLGKGVGDVIAFTDSQGREFKVKLVALLAGSVLQGKVIINEKDFLAKFPDAAGYKFFLLDIKSIADTPVRQDDAAKRTGVSALHDAVRAHLTRQLETRGLALEPAAGRLAAFNAVQNSYIGIFTVLGGFGVLLGTAGLGVLAMRNVLERRGEFGLMQAIGFRAPALRRMVVTEHAALLVGGLILGLASAAIAVWPNVKQSGGALPMSFLLWLNLGILAFGIAACWMAAVLALRGRLLDAVRRE